MSSFLEIPLFGWHVEALLVLASKQESERGRGLEPIPTAAVKHVLLLSILVLPWGHPRLYPNTYID